jgi:hypothetical protein
MASYPTPIELGEYITTLTQSHQETCSTGTWKQICKVVLLKVPALLEHIVHEAETKQRTKQQKQEEFHERVEVLVESLLTNHEPVFYCKATDHYFIAETYKEDVYERGFRSLEKKKQLTSIVSQRLGDLNLSAMERTLIQERFMERTQERGLQGIVPESEIIQRTLALFHPLLFSTKGQCKYFLTLVGDKLLRKDTTTRMIMSPSFRTALTPFLDVCTVYFGTKWRKSAFQLDLRSGQEQEPLSNPRDHRIVRVLPVTDIFKSTNLPHYASAVRCLESLTTLEEFIDIAFVAMYYSQQHQSAETWLQTAVSTSALSVESSAFLQYLDHKTVSNVVAHFFEETFVIEKGATGFSMSDICFLWKQFVATHCCWGLKDGILFQSLFRKEYFHHFNIADQTDNTHFLHLSSKVNLCHVQWMKSFLDECVVRVDPEDEHDELYGYEVSEINAMYGKWLNEFRRKPVRSHSDDEWLEMMDVYFPTFAFTCGNQNTPGPAVNHRRIVYGIRCSIWEKKGLLFQYLHQLFLNNALEHAKYEEYQQHAKIHHPFLVSKHYFNLCQQRVLLASYP